MKTIATSLFVLIPLLLLSQIEVSGTVVDRVTQEVLIGATISADGRGAVTDDQGAFSFSLDKTTQVVFSYIGYADTLVDITRSIKDLKIQLSPSDNILDLATVTSSRYEEKYGESTVSIDILPTRLIENSNSVTISDVLAKVPGVQMLDGQANIRGGSGFSYGAGSRVMLLLNDMPILQPDAAFPSWNDIPVENIAQVEVLKGSASAMYGSSALNGIINVRTKYATAKPETTVTVGAKLFGDYKRESIQGSTETPYEYFVSAVHRSRLKENLDIVVHGHFLDQESYADSTYQNRGRVGLTTRYRLTDRLTLNLNTMLNVADNSSFFIWADGVEGNLSPFEGTISATKNTRFIIDPSITYYDGSDNRHHFQARFYALDNDNSLNQSNSSKNIYSEYQFQRSLERWDLNVSAGIVNQFLSTDSELFSNVKFTSYNLGAYIQLDKRVFQKLKLSFGSRYEYNDLNVPDGFEIEGVPIVRNLNDGSFIFKGGANYAIGEYSFLRASFGQGYRFPTVVERFITTTFGSFAIKSNPILTPEFGWTAELGFKQGFKVLGFKGFLDLAVFRQEYQDMLEFVFLPSDFAFQSQNIGNTEINGIELGVAGELKIGSVPISIFGGYTYIDPRYKDYETSSQIRASLSEPDLNVLKYRSKHFFKIDVEAQVKAFSFAISSNASSHIINIDGIFEAVGGIGDYRDMNNSGFLVSDFRLAYTLYNTKFTFLLNNVFNVEYTLRPAELEAPRNIGLRMQHDF